MPKTKDPILADLNPSQKEAVVHTQGPLLIIAGAGTGKTTVITRRIANLIVKKLARPEEILALTFTDKAALEMQERVDVMVPYGFTDTWISTFHAFGDRVLRENALETGLSPDFQVLSRPETAVFFREHLFEFPLTYYRPLSDPTRFIESLITLFSRAKDEDVSCEEYIKFVEGLAKKSRDNLEDEALKEEVEYQKEIAACYKKYQEILAREGKIDFGNQFYLTLQLFRQHPRILRRYQEQFKYILVDEFQDTNYAQFELVKLLAGKNPNLTVVADDDQSIYKWRGAAISNILNFNETYKNAKKISLTQNYRSTQKILDAAYRLIQNNNPDRFEVKANINKRLVGLSKEGQEVTHLYFDTISAEADGVAEMIAKKVNSKKYQYQDFAILVRSNNDADPFLRALNMRSIPWRFSGSQGLYSKEEVRLCIAFLRLMANPADSLSLYYLCSSEIYKVPIFDLTKCMNYCRRRHLDLFSVLKNAGQIEELKEVSAEFVKSADKVIQDIEKYLKDSRILTTGRLLYTFLINTGYIKGLIKEATVLNEDKLKNLAEFFEMVRNFETVAREDRVMYFINYLDMLISAGDDPATAQADMDESAVNILTIHKAKGLEFNAVFLVSLVMGRFPWPHRHEPLELPEELIKDILPAGDFHIQEERRLFYVGMTRARKELYLTSALDYGTQRARKLSCFVNEALGVKTEKESKKSQPLERIQRSAPLAKTPVIKTSPKTDELINLSFYQVDDYLTCPLKYKYVHILRVPIMEHHTVLYGKALHDAVQKYHQYKIKGLVVSEGEVLEAFEDSFKPEGFLSREHLEERQKIGREALSRFFKEQEKFKIVPRFVEKDFSFVIGNDRIVGRWDRIDERDKEIVIVDFKSSDIKKQKDADKRTKESLQLSIYCLAYQNIFQHIPEKVELHFLESGIVGSARKTAEDLEEAVEKIKEASAGIRQQGFIAKPAYMACTYCAFSQICPASVVQRR
ncbi:MAG: UvrD-helicase domain-containing protein [Candidatus Omnitrophota bacterium]|nr:UvrD-helicase domain-containing protein [Candidatus Omnitrophota bacterium]